MSTTAVSRRGFRGRLALAIAASFIGLGIVLVAIQYFVLAQSFQTEIGVSTTGGGPTNTSGTVTGDCVTSPAGPGCSTDGAGTLDVYRQTLADDVMSNYLAWSIAVLAVLAILAAIVAWYLTRSPARKITGISALAAGISAHDLSRRIEVHGPHDEITELSEQINTMLSRLEEAFASQERFVANASHELRTPITTARTALEAPLTQGSVPEHLQPYLRRALRANQRMEELIAALLMLARSRHIAPEEVTDVDLTSLITHTMDDLAEQAHARRLTVTTDLPPLGTTSIQGHQPSLVVAVHNLLTNAVQHNRDNGQISIRVENINDRVALTVANTGPTYTPEEAASLREPFNRGSHTRRAGVPGTGLGLSIIESIAAAHDGTLTIEPGSESGLVAVLTIPRSE